MNKTYIIKLRAIGGIVECEEFDRDNVLEQLQKAVGGYIERIPLAIPQEAGQDIDCFVNEDGLRKCFPVANGIISRIYGDTILGNAVFAKHNADGETLGLTAIEGAALGQWLKSKGANLTDIYGQVI